MPDFSAFDLTGRRALVTGAGRGIGRAIAEALSGVGAEVVVHYHSSCADAEQVVQAIGQAGGTAHAIGADLTDSSQADELVRRATEAMGGLDILVNNAGDLVQRCHVEQMEDELLDKVLRINIHTAVYTTRAAVPHLKQGTKPSVINLSSLATHTGGGNGATIYASTKAAIHTFTRGLAKELAPTIRVNAIAPGIILTDFHVRNTSDEQIARMAADTPLQRSGEAHECASAAVFLAGGGAAYITGEVIEINGGIWMA